MASDRLTPDSRQRNPITQEAHRRQAFWQIYFPLIAFGVLLIVAIVLAILAENEATSKWADISLIYIISVLMVIFVIIIAVLIVSAYYTGRIIKESPYFFFLIQKYTYLIEIRVKRASNVAVEPILRLNGYIAGLRALRRK
jgi:ABC-type sugar transport system permease subunit